MKKSDYDLITDSNISQVCFEPLIKTYKNRVADQISLSNIDQMKEQFYRELTHGQRALFMFYAYYNHVSKSLTEFYWWSAFFFAQPKSWSPIKTSMMYFDDQSLLISLEMIEEELKRHHYPNTIENFSVKRENLELNKELKFSLESIYADLDKVFPITISKINKFIEQNKQEFIEIIE